MISHRIEAPFLYAGNGETDFVMDKGNFDIKDRVHERVGLSEWKLEEGDNAYIITLYDGKGREVGRRKIIMS